MQILQHIPIFQKLQYQDISIILIPLHLKIRKKISQALDILGYKKNKLAKVLANGKSEFIGIIIPNLYLHYYSEMLTQLLSSYSDYHYKFLVFSSEHGAEEEQQYI